MSHRMRQGVSSYVEAFVLIGIAAGGSALVLSAALPFASSLGGPSVAVQDEGIRQGAYLAIESLTVLNVGRAPITSFVVSTSQVSSSASYCYSIYDLATGARSAGTCPATAKNPGSVAIDYPVQPGEATGVAITIIGSVFEIGSTYTIAVTTSAGGQEAVDVLVAPA